MLLDTRGAPCAQMHSMLAFEFAGGWSDFKGSIAVTVLQFLLGGGGSFSSGGPGASSTRIRGDELSSPAGNADGTA